MGFVKLVLLLQLLECNNDWSLALKEKKSVDIVYLDFAKAFDTVSHEKLVQKLLIIMV